MNKPFCDMCGKPAYERSVGLLMDAGKPWRGTRMNGGGCTDGTFQPIIYAMGIFYAYNFKEISEGEQPNLCAKCILSLLRRLTTHIEESKRASDFP